MVTFSQGLIVFLSRLLMHIYYKQYLSFPGLGNRGCFRSKVTTPSTIIGPSDILVCADEYLRTCSITYHKGAFIKHVDIAGGGGSFYQMSILINCQKGGMGVKNVQKSVHMVYESPPIGVTRCYTLCTFEKSF